MIRAGTADQHVIVRTAFESVDAFAAFQQIIAAVSADDVLAF